MKAGKKYYGIFVLLLMLFLVSCSNGPSENTDSDEPAVQSSYIYASFINDIERAKIAAGDNGNIYVADGKTIYILDREGNEINQIVHDENFGYLSLTTSKDGFFVSNTRRGLEEYSSDGTLKGEYDFLMEKRYSGYAIEKILHINGKVYVLYYHSDNHTDKYLAEYDLRNEKLKEINIENVRNIVKYREDMILVFLEQGCCSGHMLVYDTRNGEKGDEIHVPGLNYSSASYYSSSKDLLYIFQSGTVYTVSLNNKELVETFTSSVLPKNITAYFRNDTAHFIDRDQKRIIRLNMDEMKRDKSITVITNAFTPHSYFRNIIYEFGIDSGIDVEFISFSLQEYATKLNTMIMSADSSFDIFLLSSYNDMISYYVSKDTYEDLSSYPVVSEKFDEMFEGIRELCSYEGALFGVPVGMSNTDTVYRLNINMLEELGLEMPEYDWTWMDFEGYAEKVTADGRNYMMQHSEPGFWLFNIYAVSNCFQVDLAKGAFTYEKTDIENELEFVKGLFEKKYIFKIDEGVRNTESQENILLNAAYLPAYDGNLDGSKIIPAPVFNDKRAYPFNMNYFCINKASENKQEAAAFLGKCISWETQSHDMIISIPILYKDKTVYGTSIYNEFINDEWNYEVYRYMLKNSHRNEFYSLSAHILDYARGFFEGRLTSGEAAEAILNKMKLMIEE